jgi:hypothetical protein
MIRCRILNFKNFDFILMFKKYRVRRLAPIARYLSWTSSRMARDFSPRTVKISRRAVNLMTSLQNINIVHTLVGGFTARREILPNG